MKGATFLESLLLCPLGSGIYFIIVYESQRGFREEGIPYLSLYQTPEGVLCYVSKLALHFCGKNVKRRQALLRCTYNMTQVVTKQDTKRVEPYVRMTESFKINLT